jgi:uncharacterized protein
LGRLILFLIVALVLWWVLRPVFRSREGDAAPSRSPKGEDMVACARCGVNLPASDAREEAGRYYCVNNPHCPPGA